MLQFPGDSEHLQQEAGGVETDLQPPPVIYEPAMSRGLYQGAIFHTPPRLVPSVASRSAPSVPALTGETNVVSLIFIGIPEVLQSSQSHFIPTS